NILAGALTLGNGSPAALGASLGVDPVLKTTEAFIAPGAVVNAQANAAATVPVFTNRIDGGGNFSTTTARGVAVQAASSEHLVSLAVSGAASATNPLSVALSGAAAVQYVDSDTRAYIGDGAQVNQATGAGGGQAMNVAAVNQAVVKSVLGDGALG